MNILKFTMLNFVLPSMLWGQMTKDVSFVRIDENLMTQLEVFPQEKIHLHTDRDVYVPGEKIWFKAYVTDAVTHQYSTFSQYAYVELISPADTLVNRVMILQTDSMFHGHLPLIDFIPEGNYTLRAYTRYMENLGDDYFFKKNIRIGNLSAERGNRKNRESRGQVRDDYNVSFFPEGGNLLEGVFCKVVFKALKSNGSSESISGDITDESGAIITSIETRHAGMGAFSLIPNPEKRYFLHCRNGNGLEKQFELPRPVPNAYALTASQKHGRLSVAVNKSANSPDISCYLLAHCRGMALYFDVWDKKNELVFLSEEILPSGVIQFVLFDRDMNPLSERLVFCKNDDHGKIELHTDKALYEKRDKVVATLSLTDPGGNLLNGNLSVAVTDNTDIKIDDANTILSTLLLFSELKGYIENPAYYLQDDAQSTIALNYLMMTHGWRRYHVQEVAKGNLEYPQIPFQMAQEIRGKAISPLLSRPVSQSDIMIMSNDGGFLLTATDANGQFVFKDFVFPDSTRFFIQALNSRGKDNVVLAVADESFPALIHAPQSLVAAIPFPVEEKESKPEVDADAFIVKAEKRSKFDEDMRVYNIDEVIISAPRIRFNRDEPRLRYWANENSDITIRREDFEKTAPKLISDLLKNTPGVNISPFNEIRIRHASFPPLFFIDGVPGSLESISVHDVESIDVFKGASAAMFGVRGEGGVISITTKRWEERPPGDKSNQIIYMPLDYQKPVEFYAPKYKTQEAKWSVIPDYRTTIFWKPDVVISDEGKANFEFYTSDYRTTYSVVIEGLTQWQDRQAGRKNTCGIDENARQYIGKNHATSDHLQCWIILA